MLSWVPPVRGRLEKVLTFIVSQLSNVLSMVPNHLLMREPACPKSGKVLRVRPFAKRRNPTPPRSIRVLAFNKEDCTVGRGRMVGANLMRTKLCIFYVHLCDKRFWFH